MTQNEKKRNKLNKHTDQSIFKRPIDAIMDSGIGMIVCATLGALLALVFIFLAGNYEPTARAEAVAFTGEYLKYESYRNTRCVVFSDGSKQYLYPHTETAEFQEHMETLPIGTVLHLSINPNTDDVLEIRTDTEELLNFDVEQAAIAAYVKGYVWMGAVLLLCSAFLLWFALKRSSALKKEQAIRQQKSAKREDSFEDTALRRADFSQKHRILLETKIDGYQICYRRIKSVNELVINGLVYDERKAILEFEHTLSASLDGHLIKAGLDRNSNSFISFDGNTVAQKKRLV